jgi:hypothetical protein
VQTYTFRKRKGRWYLELPPRLKEFKQTDFTQVEESGGALDEFAHGKSQVDISIDTRPLKSSSVLELEAAPAATGEGGYYRLLDRTGRLLKDHLNLTDLDLLLIGEYPERIYLRRK